MLDLLQLGSVPFHLLDTQEQGCMRVQLDAERFIHFTYQQWLIIQFFQFSTGYFSEVHVHPTGTIAITANSGNSEAVISMPNVYAVVHGYAGGIANRWVVVFKQLLLIINHDKTSFGSTRKANEKDEHLMKERVSEDDFEQNPIFSVSS